MDLSKLPKLSESPAPAPPPPQVAPQRPAVAPREDLALRESPAAEAWISIAIGVILMLLSPRLFQFILAPGTFDQKWTFNDPSGAPLAYPKTVFFWGDVALIAFALVLIVEGLVIAFGKSAALLAVAFVLTALVTALNFFYVVAMMWSGYGAQIFSLLAVAFGGYIAFYQWRLLKAMLAARRARSLAV